MERSGHVSDFFYFLFLYLSLKLKTQPIQLRDRPFNMQGEGAWFFAEKNNLMLNFEKTILWRGWVQKKTSETVFSQHKIMLHLEKKYIHTGQTEMLCSHLGNGTRYKLLSPV
jgi:hypothetical protein